MECAKNLGKAALKAKAGTYWGGVENKTPDSKGSTNLIIVNPNADIKTKEKERPIYKCSRDTGMNGGHI